MQNINGHTLPELMICLLIGSILLSIAAPTLTANLQRSRQAEATNLLLGAVHYARSAAVMSRQHVSLCSGNAQCVHQKRWQQDLLVFIDQNDNGLLDQGEVLLRQIPKPAEVSWYWSNYRNLHYLQFEADGTPRGLNGTLTLCLQNQPAQQIVINVAGRARTRSPASNARCT